jgi:hypothetical protein
MFLLALRWERLRLFRRRRNFGAAGTSHVAIQLGESPVAAETGKP